MSDKIKELTDSTFEAEIQSGVTLVDFWAPWCGPCRMQAPILESLADKIGATVKICKLNVDEAPATATRFRVMSIPTLKIFKDGKEVQSMVGVQQEARLIPALQAAAK